MDRIKAYRKTSTDTAAARLVGLTTQGFRAWRVRHGFKPKAKRGRPEKESR